LPGFFRRDLLLAAESRAWARGVLGRWARVGVPAGPAGGVAVCGEDAWVVGMGMIVGRLLRAASGVVPVWGAGGCSEGGAAVAVVGVWVGV
jgi:hypothetical protein